MLDFFKAFEGTDVEQRSIQRYSAKKRNMEITMKHVLKILINVVRLILINVILVYITG